MWYEAKFAPLLLPSRAGNKTENAPKPVLYWNLVNSRLSSFFLSWQMLMKFYTEHDSVLSIIMYFMEMLNFIWRDYI